MERHIHYPNVVEGRPGSSTHKIVICTDPACDWTIPFAETILTQEEFEEKFHPQKKENGDLFDHRDVKHLDYRNVWSIVENGDDNNWYALPGFHVVNMLGYVTSTVPWTDDIAEAMYFLDDFDHEDDDDDF